MIKNIDNYLTPAEVEHRKEAFNQWLRDNGDKVGYYLLPPAKQDSIRCMLRKAFYAGSNYEARVETVRGHRDGEIRKVYRSQLR